MLLVNAKIRQWLTSLQSEQKVTFQMLLLLRYGIHVYCMVYILQYGAGPVVYGRHVLQVMNQPTKHISEIGEGQDSMFIYSYF